MFKAIMQDLGQEMQEEHAGAVAFEYIIILVIMAVAIFTAWGTLGNQVISKANEISNFIASNGTNALGTGTVTTGDTGKFVNP